MINAVNPNISSYNVNNLSNQQIKKIKDDVLEFCNRNGIGYKNIAFGPNKSIVFTGVDKNGDEFRISLDARNLSLDQIVSELKNKIGSEAESRSASGSSAQYSTPDPASAGGSSTDNYLWKFVLDSINNIRSNIRELIIEEEKKNEELNEAASKKKWENKVLDDKVAEKKTNNKEINKKMTGKKMERAKTLESRLKIMVDNKTGDVQQINNLIKELKSDFGDDKKMAALIAELEKNVKELRGQAMAMKQGPF